jgi:hypothetical protein
MPAGNLTPELFHTAAALLWLTEAAYWLAFIKVAKVLFVSLTRRRWFEFVSGLALALFIWPWSPIAAKQLVWMLF